jgi:hypothetical protein
MSRSTIVPLLVFGPMIIACATSAPDPNAEDSGVAQNDASSPEHDSGAAPKKDSGSANDATTQPQDDGGTLDAQTLDVVDASGPQPVVFGHSPDSLYTFDVTTNKVTLVGAFQGCSQSTLTQVIDLAINAQMHAYATTFDGFYSVDLTTAQCTLIKAGSYPNSLSFVPVGTLDPNIEALVGYFGSSYVRINVATGNTSTVGGLTGGYASSGDIVSVEGGGTFLTVTGNGCADCLFQVDPKTGDMIQNYGALPHGAVYGLGYWAGTLFGFDATGDLFSISGGGDGGLVTSDVIADGGVVWWGAGSTTVAPKDAPDGGAIETQ